MIGPVATLLGDGKRLHLQHGPIDLIIGADGDRDRAFSIAQLRFQSVLDELVAELPTLREPMRPETHAPAGEIARAMHSAVTPFANAHFVTRMAAVAGSVADAVLHAIVARADVTRAYVNNGGDIAIHLSEGQSFSMAMAGHDGAVLGQIKIDYADPIRGIATSGQPGRSFSLGIADSVTVLAQSAAAADVAATLIANAVDLPGHPAVHRQPAHDIDENSDLGATLVVKECGVLSSEDAVRALAAGQTCAQGFARRRLIDSAALFLQGQTKVSRAAQFSLSKRTVEHA